MHVDAILKKTVKWSLIGISALLLFAGLLFGVAQTGPGKERIRAIASNALGKDRAQRIDIGKIDGFIPFDIRLDHLTFWDSDSQWLRLEGVSLRWSPLRLLGGNFVVDELHILSARVSRPPVDKKEKAVRKQAIPSWLRILRRLQIQKFSVETMALDPSVLGEQATFKMEAGLGISLSDGAWKTRINIKRLDRNGAPTTLKALFEGKGTDLSADALMEEPAGGLVAKSLGIEGPLLFSLKGKGPTDSWKGTVIAEGGSLGELRAGLGLSMSDEDLRVIAKGQVHINPAIVPDPLIHWVDQNTPFEFRGSIHGKSRLTIDELNMKSERASLQIKASTDLETEAIDGQFKLQSKDLSPMESLVSIKGTGGTLDGHFSGSLLKPEASLNFVAAEVQAGDMQVKDTKGQIKVTFVKPINVAPIEIRVQSAGKFGEMAFNRGKERVQEKDVAWDLAVEGPPEARISIRQLRLTGGPASVLLSGSIDTSRRTGSVDADIDIADLSVFSRFVNRPLAGTTRLEAGPTRLEAGPTRLQAGRTRLQAKITGDAGNRSLSARITGEYYPPEVPHAPLASLVDRKVGYSGLVTYDGQKKIKGTGLLLETVSGTIKGDVDYDLGDGALNGVFQMEIPHLDRFSSVLGKRLAGSVSVKGAIKGPFQNLDVDAQIESREVRFEQMTLKRLSAGLRIDGFPPENKGQLDFDLFIENERVQGKTHFTVTDRYLSLSDLSVNGAGVKTTGALSLDLEQRLIKGKLQGATNDLIPVSALFKQDLKGAARIDLEASGTKSGQRIVFKMDSSDVSSRGVSAGTVNLQGEIDHPFNAPEGSVTVSFRDGKYKRSSVSSLELNVRGTPKQFHFKGHVKGKDKADFDLETSGRMLSSPDGSEIFLELFQGRYGKLPVTLVRPVVVKTRIDGLDVEPMTLQIGAGRLEGSGTIGKEASLSVQFIDLPLSALPVSHAPELTGTANGQVQVRGSSGNPEVAGRLRVTGLGVRLPQTEDLPPGTLEVKTDLRGGRLRAEISLQGLAPTPLRARFEAPMTLTLAPFSMALPEGDPVSGDFKGEVDLGLIEEIYALHDQVLDGRMAFDLTFGGRVGAPKIHGGGSIKNGRYENVRSGTILKDIDMIFEAEDHRLVIQNMQASDGESGKIKAQGWIDIDPAEGFPFSFDLDLDEAKTWRHDDLMVILRGPLKLSGSLKSLLLEGRIQIAKAEIRIPDRLPPEIVQLEVVEINADQSGSTLNTEHPPASGLIQKEDIRLDVSISSPGHIFVEGRGLISEWRGDIQVNGTVAAPIVTGQLSVVRGHVNFLGKRFNLSRGIISFSGATPPSPQIEVLTESRTNDITARIELDGPVNHPSVKLSSDPELPQDEVLSQVLFGRNLANITPYQAVQLASAANTLTGGGGFDLLGQTRKILGIDQLEIKNLEGGKGETAISAGKYLSENVYMEVEKGLGPKGGKGSVVWEITPNISVETEVGENATIGGGVNWKWDY